MNLRNADYFCQKSIKDNKMLREIVRWRRMRYIVTNADICARFFSMETSVIELKHYYHAQNCLNSRWITFYR